MTGPLTPEPDRGRLVGHALQVGARRGWTEFLLSLRSGQDQSFYLAIGVGVVVYLWFNRSGEVPGTDLSYPAVFLPGILGSFVVFGAMLGPAFGLAMEQEDGTLLRARAAPYGFVGYVAGAVVYHGLGIVPMVVVVLVPSALLFDTSLPTSLGPWLQLAVLTIVSVLATLPVGMVIGAAAGNVRRVASWGFFPFIAITGISGVVVPMQLLWTWLQYVAQVFPVYWVGLGMRSVSLPAEAAELEITGTWRTAETFAVLGAWALVGLCLLPFLLRRLARRQSGSAVASARERTLQTIQ